MNVKTQPNIGNQTGSTALASHLQVKTAGAVLVSLLGYNSGPDQYIQLHDSATTPSEGATPVFMLKAFAGQTFYIDTPIKFLNGIYVCNSSTPDTKTLNGEDCWFLTRDL